MSEQQKISEQLESKTDEDLLFMASIIRLILDDRKVWYPSRESENIRKDKL